MSGPINNINRNWERAILSKLNKTVSVSKEQTFTEEEQAQGRQNLGIEEGGGGTGLFEVDIQSTSGADMKDAYNEGKALRLKVSQGNDEYVYADFSKYSESGSEYEFKFSAVSGDTLTTYTYNSQTETWTTSTSAIPELSTNIYADKTSDVKTATPKAVYTEVHPAVQSSQPAGGFLPNVEYNLGTLTGNVTFALASAVSGIGNKWYWCFIAGATAPTITWPTGLLWPEPDAEPPTIEAGDEVEVEVKNGHIVALVFKPTP